MINRISLGDTLNSANRYEEYLRRILHHRVNKWKTGKFFLIFFETVCNYAVIFYILYSYIAVLAFSKSLGSTASFASNFQ